MGVCGWISPRVTIHFIRFIPCLFQRCVVAGHHRLRYPIAILNPYLAGGLFADYLVRGRHPQLLEPDNLRALTAPVEEAQDSGSVGTQAPRAAVSGTAEVNSAMAANSGLKEIKVAYE
jgi:hypothetical protein